MDWEETEIALDEFNIEDLTLEEALNVDPEDSAGSLKHKGFISQDYNLNSPLISDYGIALYSFLRTSAIPDRYEHHTPKWNKVRKALERGDINPRNLISPEFNHKMIPEAIELHQSTSLKVDVISRWKKIWEKTKAPSRDTIKIVTGKILKDEYSLRFDVLRSPPPELRDLKNLWNLFLDLHFITHLINCTMEHQNTLWAGQLFKLKLSKDQDLSNCFFLYNKRDLLKWIIIDDIVINVEIKSIWDKNFVLMMKDITLSRTLSLMSLINRTDRNTQFEEAIKLHNLYKLGDEALRNHGNAAYKGIKLLEAECTDRWVQLGHKHRPLIPKSNSLREHLNKSIGDLTSKIEIHTMMSLIREENDPNMIAMFYGSFRHWGHPYIDYLKGVSELESRVNQDIEVDEEYANKLASDLAYLVLRSQFQRKHRWFADSSTLKEDDPLKQCIDSNVWPTSKVIEDFGDKWHTLHLLQCFEIPDAISMSDLYSDKAHSIQRSEVIQHILDKNPNPIRTKRVMETLLEREEINIYEFLKEINEKGLDWDDLIIGLKAKERELKDKGRYYSLMGWKLRLYFVLTEYLIKKYYVPLFSGITVADDLNTVTKKLLSATEGQGRDDYDKVYIANSIDYEKWNNRQRMSANKPVFRVMGQFLGLSELFVLTHTFFQTSLIYYLDRPDLLGVENNRVVNLDPSYTLAWEGQKGGFEGLRQKGWSVVNYLVLRREALTRNTKTKFLAQGDNQIVITQYSLMIGRNPESIIRELNNIWSNNRNIMSRIREATSSLGLIVNEDEVMTSAELLIYGKIPVYRGKVLSLETKRWARISSITNDQLPSFSNSMASCTTNALSVSQYSENTEEVLLQHHYYMSLTASLLTYYNAILGIDPFKWETLSDLNQKMIMLRMLYKDPSLGGVCGTNLLRFFISRFPDPVTESLTWWKLLYHSTQDKEVKTLAVEIGNPHIGSITYQTLTMLLENPESLNIPGGVSSDTMIQMKVFEGLKEKVKDNSIKNKLIRETVMYTAEYKEKFVMWLFSIHPIFPRFISEFYTSTYFKIAEGVVSVFQNSRTIRRVFSKRFPRELFDIIKKSESQSLKSVKYPKVGYLGDNIWLCSAQRADLLRKKSWGPSLVGVTTPHPAEFLKESSCTSGCQGPHVVAKKIPTSQRKKWSRGMLMPYLGSKTKESTSILQPWEKQVEIPLLRRACDLRKTVNWFIDSGSNLAETIYDNLQKLTGLDLREEVTDYKRTGSSKHRLRCSRVSNEGNPAVGFNNLMYVTVTTDGLGSLNEENHDFMYQSILCWVGVLSTLNYNSFSELESTHFHIVDKKCIREIKEDILESKTVFRFPDKTKSVRKMLTKDIDLKYKPRFTMKSRCDWDSLSVQDKSWNIGRAQGFLWGLAVYTDTVDEASTTLFPNTISRKVDPGTYLDGLHRGFSLGATLSPMYTRYGSLSEKARLKFEGCYWELIDKALSSTNLGSVINQSSFSLFLSRTGMSIIKSYPATHNEITNVLRTWFLKKLVSERLVDKVWEPVPVIIFADMNSEYIIGMFRLAESIYPAFQRDRLSAENLTKLKNAKLIMRYLSDFENDEISDTDYKKLKGYLGSRDMPGYQLVSSETRHAVQSISPSKIDVRPTCPIFTEDKLGTGGDMILAEYQPEGLLNYRSKTIEAMRGSQIRCTLFSSLRIVQFSTGAHYKYKDIISRYKISGNGIFCGDGSGGIGACHLRLFKNAQVIYNSKLDLEGESWKGLAPLGPGAYVMSGPEVVARCLNFKTCWEEPSDLSHRETWDNFLRIIHANDLKIEVICCDAEVYDKQVTDKIEDLILEYIGKIFQLGTGTLIYKTYWSRFLAKGTLAHRLGLYFNRVSFFLPDTQGSFTSEIYVVAERLICPRCPTKTELSLATLLSIYSNLKLCYTYQQEFFRCLGYNYTSSISGMEQYVPFLSLEEVAIFLTSVGLETGLALKVSETLSLECEKGIHPIGLMWWLGHMLSRSILPVTRWSKPGDLLPSSNKLQKLVAAMFGIWLGVILIMEDELSFSTVTHYYQREIPLSFGKTSPFKGKSGNYRQFLTWRFSEEGSIKSVDPGPRAGITQQMTRLIRILYRGYSVRRAFNIQDLQLCESLIFSYDKKLNLPKLSDRAGLSYVQLFEKFQPYEFIPYVGEPEELEDSQTAPEELD